MNLSIHSEKHFNRFPKEQPHLPSENASTRTTLAMPLAFKESTNQKKASDVSKPIIKEKNRSHQETFNLPSLLQNTSQLSN